MSLTCCCSDASGEQQAVEPMVSVKAQGHDLVRPCGAVGQEVDLQHQQFLFFQCSQALSS